MNTLLPKLLEQKVEERNRKVKSCVKSLGPFVAVKN